MTGDGVAVDSRLAEAVAAKARGDRFNVTAWCGVQGISTKTFYKYLGRFRAEGVPGFFPRSRAPLTSPSSTPVAVEDEIVRVRKELDERGECGDNGALSIRWRLEDEGMDPVPSRATIHRVLVRRGQVIAQPRKKPNTATSRRFEAAFPNSMWHMDGFKHQLGDGSVATVIQIGDDCSRLDLADLAAVSENGDDVCTAARIAIERYGLPRLWLTDNGSAFNGARRGFTTALETLLRGLGVKPIATSVGHPQTNGKSERAHSTAERWLARQPQAYDLAELQTQLDVCRPWYNNRRHQALGGLTPQQRWDLADKARPDGTPIPDPPIITTATVSPSGTIGVDGHEIGIGKRHRGNHATVFRTGDHVVVFTDSILARTLDIDRSRHYQPTGAPQGRPPKPA
jgi:transposase InsO family protein